MKPIDAQPFPKIKEYNKVNNSKELTSYEVDGVDHED